MGDSHPKTLSLLSELAPYLAIAAVAWYIFRGIFASGLMSGYDNSLHYYDAWYLTQVLIPHNHWISGWTMQHMAGMPILVDYCQLPFLAIAFLNAALSIPLEAAYKIMVLASYALLGAGFYAVSARRFGRVASLLTAACVMLQKDIYLDRILNGVWTNYLAIGMLLIFLHLLDSYSESLTPRRAVALGLLLGSIILTHIFVAIFAFLLLAIYLAPYMREMRRCRMAGKAYLYLLIPVLGFAIASYYLYGFLTSRSYFEPYSSKDLFAGLEWSAKALIGPVDGFTDLRSVVAQVPVFIRIIFSFLGLVIFLKGEGDERIRRFLGCSVAFTLLALVLFSDILPNIFGPWRRLPFVGALQTNRFLVYVHIGAYLFAAYGISKFLARSGKKVILSAALIIAVSAAMAANYSGFAAAASRTLDESQSMADLRKVWAWVSANAGRDGSRVVYQDTIGNIDDPIFSRSDVFAVSGVFTGVAQIGASRAASPFPQERYMRNDGGRIFGRDVDTIDGIYISGMMERFNAGYIVTVEPRLARLLEGSGLFLKEAGFGPFVIFRLSSFRSEWVRFTKQAELLALAIGEGSVDLTVSNGSAGNEASVKVSYHPLWEARANGRPVRLGRDAYAMMTVSLPEQGICRVNMVFDPASRLWVAISLAAIAASAAFLIFPLRNIREKSDE
ncbi:MAG: 6-pyruvoyl-tetrahydropterin synthase-related protein [Candidatus Omnitrophota bacterium]